MPRLEDLAKANVLGRAVVDDRGSAQPQLAVTRAGVLLDDGDREGEGVLRHDELFLRPHRRREVVGWDERWKSRGVSVARVGQSSQRRSGCSMRLE
jgi:hypothetical protein